MGRWQSHPKLLLELGKQGTAQSLSENVSRVVTTRNMAKDEITILHLFSHKVDMELNVLGVDRHSVVVDGMKGPLVVSSD